MDERVFEAYWTAGNGAFPMGGVSWSQKGAVLAVFEVVEEAAPRKDRGV